jgi:hypothetical protein
MAVRLDPKPSAYHRELGLTYLHQVETSSMLKAIGMMRKCRDELDAALAIAPNDPNNLFEKMDFLLQAPGIAGGDTAKTRASGIDANLPLVLLLSPQSLHPLQSAVAETPCRK